MTCPACLSENVSPMGALGNLMHVRCMACGMEFHFDIVKKEHKDIETFRNLLLDAEIALTEAIGIMKEGGKVWSHESILSVKTVLLLQRTLGDAIDKIDEGDYE